ncbi:MAG TPA: HlyD family efflux transporter periplasmic adaptor subunit [Pirellulales bacterium]|jgi:HlyD family secretion protein|nr:HlyD family efflux transporter periplasmic adaptor subunit [Pirellulales bacterium]
MSKWIITGLILVVVGAAIVLGIGAFGSGAPVEAAKARKGPIHEFVDERGKTRLPQVYSITMPFDGRVAPIGLVEGTVVKQGEVVAQVVPLDLKLSHASADASIDRLNASIKENDDASVENVSLEQSLKMVESMRSSVMASDAQVEAARAKLDYNNKNLSRIQRLVQTKAKTEDELEQARLAQIQSQIEVRQDELLSAAMKAMESATLLLPKAITEYIGRKMLAHGVLEKEKSEAQVALDQVKKNEARGQMKSPINGVVLERMMSDERQVPSGTVLLKIGRLEELQVEADVLSQDVVEVKPGDDVEISGPAIGPTPAHGTVERVYPAGFTKVSSLGVEQQRVKVVVGFSTSDLDRVRHDRGIGTDYRVSVRIFTKSKADATVIPRSALFRGAEGKWQVFTVRDSRAHLQAVETGLMNDETVEVVKGLSEGEVVVLAPETSLADGARVSPQLRELEKKPSMPVSTD